ncbi:MAG TPA: aldo/keto reductase [Candidatus Blautia excrementipullorum]|nr:aldo/keto reductase [Candidatus Blautia excrementipullorum]
MSGIDLKNGKNGSAPVIRLNSGYDLPAVGLGTYALHGNTCTNAVTSAIKSGYRLIDTASFYGNEREVGEGVRKSGVAREEIFVQTKLYPNQYGHAAKAIDEALKKLDIGYIDMMLLHHPASNDAAAYKAIEKAIQDGKIRTAGISCYYIRETDSFLPKVSVKPALIQNEIHPYYQDSSVVKHIQNKGIVVQGWYPLGGRGYTGAMLNNPVLQEIAAAHEKSVAQVILRWNLQKDVCVIPGSGNPDHIRENISIFDFSLTAQEMESISTLNKNKKHDWY